METVTVSLDVPKEGKELVDCVGDIIAHFVDGKPLADAAALLPGVMTAVDGVSAVWKVEMKSKQKDELIAYTVHRIFESLEKEEAPTA